MDAKNQNLPPGDPQLILNIVNHLKSQGIFDQFRRECLADVDTKPAHQNLRQRIEIYVNTFLSKQTWSSSLNKNQLREKLRRQINELFGECYNFDSSCNSSPVRSGMLAWGVDHVVEQVVCSKIRQVFLPQIEDEVKKYLGLEKQIVEEKADVPTTSSSQTSVQNNNTVSVQNSQIVDTSNSVPDKDASQDVPPVKKVEEPAEVIKNDEEVDEDDEISPPFELLDDDDGDDDEDEKATYSSEESTSSWSESDS